MDVQVPAVDFHAPAVNVHVPPMDIHVPSLEGRAYVMARAGQDPGSPRGYSYRYSSNGDSYALITGDERQHMSFSGDIHTGEIDKARKMAHGDFLWFTRNGKSYVVDDPAIVGQIEAMYKPMEALGKQQEELGRKQEALGETAGGDGTSAGAGKRSYARHQQGDGRAERGDGETAGQDGQDGDPGRAG